jgi:predicted dehydrogenase
VIGLVDRDPELGIDRLAGALMEFPGGRQLSFICATQLVPYQRVQVCGTRGRIEVEVPFNALPDRQARLLIDTGQDLIGSGITVETMPVCNQYTLQGDMASRVALGEIAPPYPIEDAVATMRVIDALFRSAQSGRWEAP